MYRGMTLLWEPKISSANPVLAVQTYEQYPEHLYLLLNSTHSSYNFSRADLVFVRIFISTQSKSLKSDDNWRNNLTSHNGRHPFPDWNKKCTKKYCESFQLLVTYPVTYSISTVRLMTQPCPLYAWPFETTFRARHLSFNSVRHTTWTLNRKNMIKQKPTIKQQNKSSCNLLKYVST
jgi:hypothetical protein